MAGNEEKYRKLLDAAKLAAERTYSPYSGYPVGSAILAHDGKVFSGCNVEHASYGGAICAERSAVVKAVSEGSTKFAAIAVYCAKGHDCWPCGICRQFICEFGVDVDIVVE